MDAGGPQKQTVRLTIYNQSFTLRVAGDPADMERAANEVDELMNAIARSGNMDTARVAILACLHLQDRVRSLEQEFERLKHRVEDKSRQFSVLLDQLIDTGEPAPED
jgi:cell division protein ZapA